MNDIRVSSWNELQEALFAESWQKRLGRFRSTFVFRGSSNAEHALKASLLAGGFEDREQHLLRNFRKYASRTPIVDDSIWNWMALAQHHGLPTRLLDWTYSPFVALHFATERIETFGEEGAVWCVDHAQTNALLPHRLRQLLKREGSTAFTVEMLTEVAGSLQKFDALAHSPFVVFLEPPSLDDRIVNQFALFSLMSSPSAVLSEWLADHPHLYRRVMIPAELKWEIRDKLDQANITERVLFPGLDGLSRWLRRYYTARPTRES
jgi:hypothetical protein